MSIVVDSGCGDCDTRVHVTDNSYYAVVNKFLCDLRSCPRVRSIIFGNQFETNATAVHYQASGIDFIDSELGTVFIIFSEMRLCAGQRRCESYFDHDIFQGLGLGCQRESFRRNGGGEEGDSADCRF